MKFIKLIAGLFLFCTLGLGKAGGQDLIYQAKNPAFGGNYLNYSWMLSSADTQNKIEDPDERDPFGANDDPLAQFSESLNRQLLNQLSREIFDSQFGEGGLTEGSFVFGDFQVDISPGIEGININIFDILTGGQTQITVPYY